MFRNSRTLSVTALVAAFFFLFSLAAPGILLAADDGCGQEVCPSWSEEKAKKCKDLLMQIEKVKKDIESTKWGHASVGLDRNGSRLGYILDIKGPLKWGTVLKTVIQDLKQGAKKLLGPVAHRHDCYNDHSDHF